MEPVLRGRGGTWVGWPGIALAEDERIPDGGEPYRVEPVQLSKPVNLKAGEVYQAKHVIRVL